MFLSTRDDESLVAGVHLLSGQVVDGGVRTLVHGDAADGGGLLIGGPVFVDGALGIGVAALHDVLHQRGDDLLECSADDYADRHIHDVAAHDEGFELFKEFFHFVFSFSPFYLRVEFGELRVELLCAEGAIIMIIGWRNQSRIRLISLPNDKFGSE